MSSKEEFFFINRECHGLQRIITNNCIKLFALFALFVVFNTCAAQSTSPDDGKPQTGLATRTISIAGERGVVTVDVELARTDTEQGIGLMYRTSLEDGKGMLFVNDHDRVMSFWMKNTLIPLSIAYISYDGTIIDIRDMYPNDTTSVHSSRSVRYALEVPQGWFDRVGIKAGDKVNL